MVLPSESGDKQCYKCHLFLAAPAGAYRLIPTVHAHDWAELAGFLSSRSARAQLVRASGRNSTFHLIWIPPTTMLATSRLPLIPMLHMEWIKKEKKMLNFWRSPSILNISTAQASHRVWFGLRTCFYSFSSTKSWNFTWQHCSKYRDLPFSLSKLCIKRLKLTVECWMGIQAGVSTEHLWDGHLPWLCCKQVKMALHTTQYVLQSLGTMGSIPDGASRILLVNVRPDKIIFLSPYKICSSQDQSLPTLFSMKFSVR